MHACIIISEYRSERESVCVFLLFVQGRKSALKCLQSFWKPGHNNTSFHFQQHYIQFWSIFFFHLLYIECKVYLGFYLCPYMYVSMQHFSYSLFFFSSSEKTRHFSDFTFCITALQTQILIWLDWRDGLNEWFSPYPVLRVIQPIV